MTTLMRFGAPLLALLVLLASALPVRAHSELVSSSPAAGSTVPASPGMAVVLSFSETLKKGSQADVVGPAGTTVGTATIDPGDDTKLSWSPAAALPPGAYTIRWTSIATDGDVLRGTIPFTVAAATASPSVTSTTPATPVPPTATPAPSPTPGDVSAAGFGAIVPVVAALLAIALLGFMLLRNRRPTARR